MTSNTDANDVDTPSLFNLLQVAQDDGLVGEQESALTVATAMIHGGGVALVGPSRVGKSFLVEKMSKPIPNSDIYEMSTTLSPTALYYNAEQINQCRVHIYHDLTSLPEHIEGVLKAHAEGMPASREVTDVTSGETVEMTLQPPDCIIVCAASDNENFEWDDFPEVRNRFLFVDNDASQEQTDRILDSQARELSGLTETQIPQERVEEIRQYISSIPVARYSQEHSIGNILNIPGGVPLRNQDPIPTHFTSARDDYIRLNDFIESISLIHYQDRMEIMSDGSPTLLVTPADVWLGMKVFGEQMIMSALNLKEVDQVILEFLREEQSAFTVSKIQAKIRADGYNVTDRDVQASLKRMKNKAYAGVNQSDNPQTWYATPFAKVVDHPAAVDYERLVEKTKEVARESLDSGNAEEYIAKHCSGEGLIVTHPFSGETINIVEDTEFEEKLEEAEEEMEDMMDEPFYGSLGDSGSANEEGGTKEDAPLPGANGSDGNGGKLV